MRLIYIYSNWYVNEIRLNSASLLIENYFFPYLKIVVRRTGTYVRASNSEMKYFSFFNEPHHKI